MPDKHKRYSGAAFTPEERQQLRARMEMMERMEPVIRTYESGRTLTRAFMVVVAWLLGSGAAVIGLINGFIALGWWPWRGT